MGKSLLIKKRYDEFEGFLNWLLEIISEKAADVLLVAGDIFDSCNPSIRAQELYYDFLCRVKCRYTVIVAGNHDSGDFLKAPSGILKHMGIYVSGGGQDIEDEVIVLADGSPELIVCAVPYLRDRYIRQGQYGESLEERDKNIVKGITDHYDRVYEIAKSKSPGVPIIGTGHIFTLGGRTAGDDRSWSIYAGGIGHVSADIFRDKFAYLALGHLHIPQEVGKNIRYSGSPIAMGFKEAMHEKSITLIDLERAETELITVPVFQELVQVKGNLREITARLNELKGSKAWLEVIYEGEELTGNLRDLLDTDLEILLIKNNRIRGKKRESICLDDLDEKRYFLNALMSMGYPWNREKTSCLLTRKLWTISGRENEDN